MNTDDIDKKIALIESSLEGVWGESDIRWLVDQLKACRVVRTMLLPNAKAQAARERHYIAELEECRKAQDKDAKKIAKYIVTLEQRTKEGCFKAGWDWIQSNINAQLPMLNRELSFKQAIESAGID